MEMLNSLFMSIDDKINPVFLKELRQIVRNKLIIVIICLVLLVLTGAVGLFLLDNYTSIARGVELRSHGKKVYGILSFILALTICVVSVNIGVKFNRERNEGKIDMYSFTSLTAFQVVWGKFLSAVSLNLLLISLTLPFMVLCYLLRGIDIPTIFMGVLSIFYMGMGVASVSIFAGSFRSKKGHKKGVSAIIYAIIFVTVFFGLGNILSGAFRMGGGRSVMSLKTMLEINLFLILLTASIVSFFFVLTMTMLASKYSNRHMPLRVCLTSIWLLWLGIVTVIVKFYDHDNEWFVVWGVLSIIIISIYSLFTIGEMELYTRRTRASIADSSLKRIIQFPFFNGSVNGATWSVIHYVSTLIIIAILYDIKLTSRHHSDLKEFLEYTTIIGLYFYCYLFSANLFRLLVDRKRTLNALTGTITACIIGFTSIVNATVLGIQESHTPLSSSMPDVYYGSIFAVFFQDAQVSEHFVNHLVFAGIWLAIVLIFHFSWFLTSVAAFIPYKVNPEGEV